MQKTLKIIHITSDYPPCALWGMGVYVEILQSGFSKKHKDIHSCVATTSKSLGEEGVCIVSSKEQDLLFLSQDKNSIFDNFEKFLIWQELLAGSILKYFKRESSENTVLHVNNWMSWLTAKKVCESVKLPIVSSIHFLQKQYEVMIENPIPTYHDDIIKIEKEMLSNSDEIICFSAESKKVIDEKYRIKRGGISIIPHTSKIRINDIDIITPTHNILYLGRLTHDKGILDVIQIVESVREKYSNAHLHVIGNGELYGEILKKALPFVTLHGYVDDAQKLKEIAKQCSFSILSSTSDVFPISVIDSMACGSIPFLPNIETVATMFESGVSGFRVDEDFSKNTSAIIIDLLGDDDNLVKMRENTQKYYKANYSIDYLLDSTRKVYEKVLINYKL